MSSALPNSSCNACTETPVTVQVPGPAGGDGADGAAAVAVNAYTETSAAFTVPEYNENVTIDVDNSSWMAVGLNVFIQAVGYFKVVSKPDTASFIGQFLGNGDAIPEDEIAATDLQVSPAGPVPSQVIGSAEIALDSVAVQSVPITAKKYLIRRVIVIESSATAGAATVGVYGNSDGVSSPIAAAQAVALLTGVALQYKELTLENSVTNSGGVVGSIFTLDTLYAKCGVAGTAGATATVVVFGDVIQG